MISCIFSKDYVCTGETVVCLLKGIQRISQLENAIFFAQVHGHENTDFRWLKSNKKVNEVFVESTVLSLDNTQLYVNDPLSGAQHHTSTCIFSTSRVAVSPTHIFEGGTFLEFEIPSGALPTYKGLCASIHYFVSLVIQLQTVTEVLNFPMIVQGAGSNTIPYQIRHSSLVAYPATALPVEVLLSAPTIGSSGEQREETYGPLKKHVIPTIYMIRNRDHICKLRLPLQYGISGRDLQIHLDFTECIEECSVIRAILVQKECRPDESRIQEKIVSKTIRTASEAEFLDLSLYVPSDTPCSFRAPLFQVEYRIDLDFCLETPKRRTASRVSRTSNSTNARQNGSSSPAPLSNQGVEAFEKAFSFSIPIVMYQRDQHRSGNNGMQVSNSSNNTSKEEDSSCSSIASIQLKALRCLDDAYIVQSI